MSWQAPNLASRPFVNLRPLRRTAWTLSVAALLLTAWNLVSYLRAGAGVQERLAAIEKLEAETETADRRLTTIVGDLSKSDIAGENRRALFLNQRIEERSFSWNLLFDRLAETLPAGVRLNSLAPRVQAPSGGRAASERSPVLLTLRGSAQDDDSLLDFVDRLYAHPSFREPNLKRESRDRGELSFDLTVTFLPEPEP